MNNIPIKPKDAQWTDAQWNSIYAKGQDVLVAAAAGSGKTAVLVERIIQKILRDEVDVDKLLVVTFTNLSAREMKHRVEQRIQQASLEDPKNEHLKSQRIKIHQAQISTLHSFCLKVIQQHYDVIQLDPNFRTISEVENVLLLEQSIDEVLEHHYENPDIEFLTLVEQLSNDRNDDGFREILKRFYYFSIANPSPFKWLDSLVDPYENDEKQQDYLKELKILAEIYMKAAFDSLLEAENLLSYCNAVEKHLEVVQREKMICQSILEDGVLNRDALLNHTPEKFPQMSSKIKKENEDLETLEDIKSFYKEYNETIQDVKNKYLMRSVDELKDDMKQLAPRIKYLVQIIKDIINDFAKKKRSRNVLDFADYEHFALQILTDENGMPSTIAKDYRHQFEEILIDEYQDTNQVQEAIISTIKRGDELDGNLFMVGDVKQSIYKFRQADPTLFMSKYHRFTKEGQQTGLRIDLSNNFRSRKEVLSTTNYLFDHMMDEAVGEINYDADARLYFGAHYYPEKPMPLELHALIKSENEDTDLDRQEQEAYYVVEQVKHILDNKLVYDAKNNAYRKATYKDIVILERGMSNARRLQKVFKDNNIPFHVNSKEGYFEQTEVRLVLSFLRTIDNPLQDIYLVGLMRSVIYQFTEDELAEIRVVSSNDDYFYQSILHYIKYDQANTQLVDKLRRFIEDIHLYQDYGQTHPVYQLIDKFYNDHYVIQYFSGLIGGKGRRANLFGLFNKAIEFENSTFRGLYQFIRFIDELIERKKDFGEENVIGPNDNVVRMMTIHSSKGLEFPYVIYSGLSKNFNKEDIRKPLVLNQKYGLGMEYYDLTDNISYPSLSSVVVKSLTEKELISEEMRLMYVALTRAKEQLILIGTVDKEEKLRKYERLPISNQLIALHKRLSVERPFNLVYSILAKHLSQSITSDYQFETSINQLDDSLKPYVDLKIIHFDELSLISDSNETLHRTINDIEEEAPNNKENEQQMIHQLTFKYPFIKNTQKPSKQSVSELKRQLETKEDGTSYDRVRQYRIGAYTYERPKFLRQERKRKANEIGTLMHTVMQHLPFREQRLTEIELDDYIHMLIDQHIIEEDAKKDIQFERIMEFIRSDLYMKIAQADEVYRELPFVVNQARVDEIPDLDEDVSIIQGMIDLIFIKDNQYYFVDYKTDAFNRRRGLTDQEIGIQLRDKYKIQMKYYKNTLETILNKRVNGYLYFFQFGEMSIEDAL
ncbi:MULTISPECIES: helicase-exonuclease AddAB subunit AddA [Staphylococcus]|jgi:ATP-dependent helicase/nuclease subunit A|uniref:helicase-exonuclease AddAB subunit AddA n=1 Tax=Staphylococcus TaxID=1279 RepID=UPI00066A71F6|nr:helicase-exonuclease AddAB subunit AddA [Staphylococcus hominis]OFM64384.1 helicase-exonuclease AddAB subunit AddA [Staphylococcus sp. HMSC068D07]OFM64524.1 helicase-exonuclease AddAB subunit AddA [Staphylococcus sp. HMSC062C01]OFU78534.1 helicase-exonuclease AddAB subunit AddA [Staphylococcus sp. HMSC10B09]MBC2955993.1 helicase-exonuclease AddAB subunit AddA [Staphylococcus hominis]MBC3060749.1 helicase-exonuclease AddAB subunit AddA [Staphylococcus hominis]